MKTNRAPYDTNKATLPIAETGNAVNMHGQRELIDREVLVIHMNGEQHRAVDARYYMGRSRNASVVYCSVWVRGPGPGQHYSGRGSAGGYGYHKQSAALNDAIRSAGIVLDAPIDGCGTSTSHVAMHAIADALGYPASGRAIV